MEGYSWYGFNRSEIHINAPKSSGGVGILIKDWIFEIFKVSVIDKSVDGVLGLKLESRSTNFNFLVFSCYLPPENSNRGRDAQSFFAHLLTQIYMNCDSDGIFLLGDFNSRIGSMSEMLFEADEITKRNQIDNCVNQHGHEFLEFLNESKFCVLNGRFADGDNYTSISKKGKAVVDFICVPQDMFTDVKYFRVLTVQSIVDDFKLHDLIGSKSKLPDHSAIVSEFNITRHCLATQTKDTRSSCSRFKLNQIPLDFMTSDIKRTALLNLIEQIERCRETL
ncbi:unnamed protein product [Mytilus edulis]|uniref:Endonuclease/exonuclease/phosphatase domain-containing protein n=1 Tax=Mytilus edulis TaxID=6550 RepID=A0A8S3Q254_MYTED|nr:unnamed protein product [Mytilus edulis]